MDHPFLQEWTILVTKKVIFMDHAWREYQSILGANLGESVENYLRVSEEPGKMMTKRVKGDPEIYVSQRLHDKNVPEVSRAGSVENGIESGVCVSQPEEESEERDVEPHTRCMQMPDIYDGSLFFPILFYK